WASIVVYIFSKCMDESPLFVLWLLIDFMVSRSFHRWNEQEPFFQRVFFIIEKAMHAHDPSRPGHFRNDGIQLFNFGFFEDACLEQGADNAFIDKILIYSQITRLM